MNTNKHECGAKPKTRLRLRISPVAESNLRAGHPWLFGDSIREQNRDGEAGELAVIYDRQDRFLAVGLFDPDSPIRLRVLHTGKPVTIDATWWLMRLTQAVERRRGLFDERTNGYRLINGESDGWPGVVLDRYDTTLVLKIYSAIWLPRLEEIVALINAQLKPVRVVLRFSRNVQPKADLNRAPLFRSAAIPAAGSGGVPPRDNSPCKTPGESAEDVGTTTPLNGPVIFLETGLRFEADVERGQKTGFFLDQRENRRRVESLARGQTVLNAFSFSGGFSLYAARGGATSVTDLDSSPHALESAKRNFALNQSDSSVAQARHESVQADTFEWLKDNERAKFDLIILDPPSFAKRETERAGAIRAYEHLTQLGLTQLKPGGILLSCSCSAHVSAEEFFGAVRSAATKTGRRFQELETTRHAPDHQATFKEAEYLKAVFLRF
ncbi:MAG: class I SAM-dependent methyltransferase [Akkermansiaceae bacterium]|nr:class I SAM-dependent methyltransferase [Verrucomicrobiales bacterium]